ncbi:MAG: helix-turn-helix domain-containing protein [Deltaproteobacteria bacterium]|nr:helix-turn-helix domain-containing protein [Deltaproteobacteria bacterium]
MIDHKDITLSDASVSDFSPDWISPPGDTIEDLLEEKGWTKAEFAERTGFTSKHVNELVKGRAALTPDAADRLSRVLGSTAKFWLTREAQYRAALEHRKAVENASQDKSWLAELPLKWMQKRGWVKPHHNPGHQVLECLRFFAVASVDAWRRQYELPLTAFRASPKFEKKNGSVATWIRKGEITTTEIRTAPFDKHGFRAALSRLRELTKELDPNVFVPHLMKTCASYGVAVAFIPAPPGCPVSGATRWLTSDKAMLLLSLRHRTNDHLWFTFFHEAAHLLLHGKKLFFIEGIDGLDEHHEREADQFSEDLLIPPAAARRLAQLPKGRASKAQILAFASEVQIAPGIVVGRMQKEGWLPYSHMNDLKIRYEWDNE